jgi:hypothetical protein
VPLTPLQLLNADRAALKRLLRANGFPPKLIVATETRALKSGRRQTGHFKSNRDWRWTLIHDHPVRGTDPQYGTEEDCKKILMVLLLTMLEFKNAPDIDDPAIATLAGRYLGRPIERESFRDSLLLEFLDFQAMRAEAENPTPGKSDFHIGHEDPQRIPKHAPENVAWRSLRSNLIQGDMTLREARIYIIRLIARYFELGEIHID